jgi:hypothetical protein
VHRVALAALALALFTAFSPSDGEMRVVNAVVDYHVEEAREFWEEVHRNDSETMRGRGVRPRRLAVNLLTIGKRRGERLAWLAARRDLLVVSKEWTVQSDPERFYARYPDARGLLALGLPAVTGAEAVVYAELKMVYSEQGRRFHLRKKGGRWRIERVVEVFMVPGC